MPVDMLIENAPDEIISRLKWFPGQSERNRLNV